jgi:hypothetical protein
MHGNEFLLKKELTILNRSTPFRIYVPSKVGKGTRDLRLVPIKPYRRSILNTTPIPALCFYRWLRILDKPSDRKIV